MKKSKDTPASSSAGTAGKTAVKTAAAAKPVKPAKSVKMEKPEEPKKSEETKKPEEPKKSEEAKKSEVKAPVKPAKTVDKKPKAGKIDQAFIEKMNKSLTDLKNDIISNLINNNEDFKEIVEGMDPKDLADIASDDIDRRMIEAIGSQDLKRLKLIDSALTRIQQGKYGLCMKCGKKIPKDRLEAIPYALMCIDCKSAEERRYR